MENNFNVDVTKKELLKHVNNDMTTNWYYLVYIRIYNKDKTMYKKAKFVCWFDSYDLCEYLDKDCYTQKDINEYLEYVAIPCFTDTIESFENTKAFYNACIESIREYNK